MGKRKAGASIWLAVRRNLVLKKRGGSKLMEKVNKQKKRIMYVNIEVDVAKKEYMIGYKKENMYGIRVINIKEFRDRRDLSNLIDDLRNPELVKLTLGKSFLMLYLECFFGVEALQEQFFDLRNYAIKLGMLKLSTETVQSLAYRLDIEQHQISKNIRWRLEQKIKIEMKIYKNLRERHKELYEICKSNMKNT